MITLIAAQSENRVIGNVHGIPWQGYMPRDVAFFRSKTAGKPIVMGRTVYEEFDAPLAGRDNYVLTHRPQSQLNEGFEVIKAEEVMALSENSDVFIIGGGSVYRQFLELADKILLNTVHLRTQGDVYFPEIKCGCWRLVSSKYYKPDADNKYGLTVEAYERIRN